MIEVPEEILIAEKMDEARFGKEIRLLSAMKLFELGRLSSGRAAQLADMSRIEFLSRLEDYQIFPLEAELSDLESHYAVSN